MAAIAYPQDYLIKVDFDVTVVFKLNIAKADAGSPTIFGDKFNASRF